MPDKPGVPDTERAHDPAEPELIASPFRTPNSVKPTAENLPTASFAVLDFFGLVIEEGALKQRSGTVYERSRKLTEAARRQLADEQGMITCVGCGFEGTNTYGQAGLGMIDIHHTQPLYLGDGTGETKDLLTALTGVAPLCPNCHRIVHRKRGHLMSIKDLCKLTGHGSR